MQYWAIHFSAVPLPYWRINLLREHYLDGQIQVSVVTLLLS